MQPRKPSSPGAAGPGARIVRGARHNTAATTKQLEGLERRGVWLASGRAA